MDALRAVEVTGTVDEHKRLHLDAPLPFAVPSRVRVIILIPGQDDMDDLEWLRTAAASPAFDFLKEPEEDVYTFVDGNPFHIREKRPMESTVIDWDGTHVPSELRKLPPGRYVVEPVDESGHLTREEENGILAALDQLDAGRGIPLTDLVRQIRHDRLDR